MRLCDGKTSLMRSSSGFSLVETLVALVILSMSLAILYQSAVGATRNARVAAEYSKAVILAESMLTEAASRAIAGQNDRGEFGDMRWQTTARALGASDEPGRALPDQAGLVLLEVLVAWGEAPKQREITLSTVVTPLVVTQ